MEIQNEAKKYSKNHVLFEKEIVIFKDDCLINFKLWMRGFTMYVTCSFQHFRKYAHKLDDSYRIVASFSDLANHSRELFQANVRESFWIREQNLFQTNNIKRK